MRTILATLVLWAGMAQAQHPSDQAIDVEPLPLSGLNKVVAEDGRVVYVSDNGRFLFVGDMIDLWSGEKVVATQTHDRIDLARAGITPQEMAIPLGESGTLEEVLFVAFSCEECRRALKTAVQEAEAGRPIGVALLDRTREDMRANRAIWCSSDPQGALRDFLADRPLEAPEPTCRPTRLAMANTFVNVFQLPALPAVLAGDGRLITGPTALAMAQEPSGP